MSTSISHQPAIQDLVMMINHFMQCTGIDINTVNYFIVFGSVLIDLLIGFFHRELFNRIAAEDMEFAHDEDSDFEIPEFGDAGSNYDEVLHVSKEPY